MTPEQYQQWVDSDRAKLSSPASERERLFSAMREDESMRGTKPTNNATLRHFHGLSPQDELPMREAQERCSARIEG